MNMRGGFLGRLQTREENYRLSDLDYRAIRLLWRYIAPHKGRLLLAGMAMLTVTSTSLLLPYLSKVAVDDYIDRRDAAGLALISLLYLGMSGFFWLASYWRGCLSGWVGQRVVHAIRGDLFHHAIRQSMAFHERERVGSVVSRLTNDVNALAECVTSGVLNLANDVLAMTGIVGIMLLFNMPLTLLTLLVVPVIVLSMSYLGRQMRRAYHQVQQELATVNAGVAQGVSGMRVIQSLSQESFTVEQFESLSLRNMRANLRVSLLFAAVFPTMTITNALGTALVLGYGGTLVASGTMTVGVLLAFLGYVNLFFGPLREMSLVYNTFQAAAAALDRISDYMNRPLEITEPVRPEQPEGGFRGEIAFRNVTFAYEDKPVIRGLNLHIDAGETMALVGESGAGKSTLAELLARLRDVQGGTLTIDGVQVRQIAFSDLRKLVTVVPQDVFLFAADIRENIVYGNPQASEAQVIQAAKQAQAHAFIETLPDGYDTQVGERGVLLSGGQKQLIAMARVLLADPRILILDEATANVDAYTEALIQQAMDEIRRNRTTLIIAHRFSTLRKADRIVVIENGRVVAQGLHDDLIESSPAYRRFYQRQWAEAQPQ